jgi:hypothetical protein
MFRTIRKKIFRLAFVSGVGAAASYFFDKDKGEERRAQAKEKANGLMGKASAGGSWQAQTERSANGFEPTVVPTSPSPSPAPPVSDVIVPPAPADTLTDTAPGTTATPAAPYSGA